VNNLSGGAYDEPLYTRMEAILMKAFEGIPKPMLPKLPAERANESMSLEVMKELLKDFVPRR
jgi:hypothetical protein